jgi:hypothetical protein
LLILRCLQHVLARHDLKTDARDLKTLHLSTSMLAAQLAHEAALTAYLSGGGDSDFKMQTPNADWNPSSHKILYSKCPPTI